MDELKQTPQQENPCAAQGSPCAGCAGCGCQAEEPVPQDAELVADLTEAAEPAAERPADTEQNTAVEEAASAAEEADHAEEEAALAPEPEETAEPAQPEWVTVVDIHFRSGGKVYYFDPDGLELKMGDHVIMDTARGAEYGICASACHQVSATDIVPPLRKVLRVATAQDEKVVAENQKKEKRAYAVCQQKILEHKLDMQLVSAECAFDGSKILFFFTADGRVDFRELVKNLASIFRTRIELRQIGVRDKAKMVGGLGVCGRPFCCTEFLDDFQPVSIKMAKTQNLSLNPTKISGTCGRLMCCLKYEQEAYESLLKTVPKQESFVDTPDGRGTVSDVNILRQTVRVRMEDHPETMATYPVSEIAVLRNGKAKKTDPPIPRDLAPISGHHSARKHEEAAAPAAEDSMPAMFRKLDEYAASAPEPQEEPTPAPEAAEAQPRRRSRRRRRSSGGAKQDAPAQEAPQQDAKPKQEHGERRPRGGQKDGKNPQQKSHRDGQKEHREDGNEPRRQSAAQEASQPVEGGENKPRSNRRRRHRSRRPKNPGAGQTPPAQGQE